LLFVQRLAYRAWVGELLFVQRLAYWAWVGELLFVQLLAYRSGAGKQTRRKHVRVGSVRASLRSTVCLPAPDRLPINL